MYVFMPDKEEIELYTRYASKKYDRVRHMVETGLLILVIIVLFIAIYG